MVGMSYYDYQGIEEERGLFKYGGNHELVEKRG